MKGSTTNKKDTKGNSVAEEDLPQVLGQAERSGIGASKDDATGLTSSEPVFNPAPPVDRSKLEVPAEPLNIEPVTEIPETPQDTAMLQVNDGDEAAGSPDSQPAVTPSPQKVLQVRESQASADIESPPTVFDDHRTSSMAEKIPEDRTRAHDKVSSQSVCASGGRKTKKGLVNCREIDVDADRQRDDLEGRDDLARVNSSGDTLMDVAEEPSAAHPNTTTLSNIQSSAVTTPNIDKSRRSNRLSYSPPLSRENCERRWNLNAPTSLVGESSKRSSSLGIPERSVAISDKRSDGPSAKRRAIVSTSTSTPPPRKTANSKAQNNTSSIFSLHTWKTLLSPSTSRWRSGMSGSKAPTEPSGGCHEPDVTPEASDGDLKRDSITDVAPSVPEQEPQSVAIQNPLVETERKQIPSPTPPEASDSPALAKRPTPPGDEPTTPTEPAPGDAPEISDSNSPQSSNGSKMATRTRGRPRMAALPIAYSIAPTKEFNVPQQVPKPPPLQTVPSTVGQHAWRAVSNNSTVRAAKSKGFGAWRAVPMNASQSASAAPPTFFTLQTETASQPVTALLPHEAPEPTSRLNCWRAVSTQSKKPATASSPKPSDSNISSTAQKITPDKVALTRNGSPGASGISPPDAMDLDTPEKAPVTSKSTESMKTSTTSADKPHRTVAVSATSTGTPSKPPPSADKPEPSVPVTESSKEEPAAKEGFIPAAENTVAGNVGTDAASPTLETPVPRNTADPATHEVSLPTVAADAKGDQQEVDDTRSDLSSVVDMEKINEGADILLWAAMGGSPALAPTLISDVPEPITPTPTTATGEPSEPAKRRKSHPRKKKAAAKPRNKAKLPPPQKSLTTVFKLSPQLLKTIVKPDNSETAPPPLPSPPPPTRLVTHMEKPIMSSIPPPPLPPSAASFTAVNIPRPQPYRRPEPTNDTTTAIPKSATASTIAGPPTTLNPTAAPKPLPPLGSFQPPKAQIKPQNQAQPPKPIQALGQPAKRTPSIGDLLASRKKQEEQRRTTSRLDSLSNRPKPPSRQTPIPPPAYVKPAAAATPPASIGKDGDETSTDEDDPKRLASTIPAIHPLGPSMIAKELPRPPAYVPKLRPASATDTPERAPSNPLSGTSKMPPLVRPGNFLYWDPNSAEKPQSKSPALGTTSGGKEWKLPTLERTGSPTLPLSLAPSASSFGFPPASTSLQPLVPLPLRPPNPPPLQKRPKCYSLFIGARHQRSNYAFRGRTSQRIPGSCSGTS
ncbi:hypothetical protein BDD12DRAFT_197050 [Trichophaea hybrida]|nr:hypothetical protein BDD12DRAFT_197050 [Trichophaea hybrida]